jgi:uncharacterized surface anchored protein
VSLRAGTKKTFPAVPKTEKNTKYELAEYTVTPFVITLGDVDTDITLTYQTELTAASAKYWANNLQSGSASWGHNYVEMSAAGLTATPAVSASTQMSSTVLTKDGSYDYKTKTTHWTVGINKNQMQMSGASITDTITAGWTIKADTVVLKRTGRSSL